MSRPFSARREVALGLGVYAVYLGVRRAVVTPAGREAALRNAARVDALERRLGIGVERAAQRLVVGRPRLVVGLDAIYMVLNIALTVGPLLWLFRRRDPRFHGLRRATALAVLGAQPVYRLAPVAPPRMLDGFVDTGKAVSGLDLDAPLVSRLYDPYGAMPSIHVAFAMVTGAGLWRTSQAPAVRAVAVAYPPAVAVLVVVTANHFVLDVVAGAALGRLALLAGGA